MKPVPFFGPYFDRGCPAPGAESTPRGYRDVPSATYHAHAALNASLLKEPSPCHMLANMMEDERDHYASPSAAECFTIGILAHWAVLEPDKIRNIREHVVECETAGLATKKAADQRAANPGKLLVTGEHLLKAVDLMRAVAMQSEAAELLSRPGVNERSGFIFADGVWRKWRPDRLLLDGTRIIDVKTTRLESLVGKRGVTQWEGECWKYGYWLQAAWYLHHHELATGVRPNAFTFIVVSTAAPFHARCFSMTNFRPDHPMYDGSALQRARQAIGLDPGEGPDKLTIFRDCAQQTEAARTRGQTLSPELLRAMWPAEEHETSGPEIGLSKAAF